MSRYTTELRYMLDNPAWTDERLGLANYPIFDETYRDTLNQHIKEFFLFWEIGFETPARFANRLGATMSLIMPYYNELYRSAKATIDPFITMRYNVHGVGNLKELLEIARDKSRDETGNSKTDGTTDSNSDTTTHDVGNTINGGEDVTNYTSNTVLDHDGENHNDSQTINSSHTDNEGDVDGSGTSQSKVTYDSEVYDHGFTVQSDTPEGFMATDNIVDDTYASSANKNRNRSEHKGTDTTDGTYSNNTHSTDSSDTNGSVDVTGNATDLYKNTTDTSGDSTLEFGKTVDTEDWGTSNTVGNVTTGSTTDNIINEIIKELENHDKNQDTENWTTYDGFSGTTMSEMLEKWRGTFLNIDRMILEELKPLFISVIN